MRKTVLVAGTALLVCVVGCVVGCGQSNPMHDRGESTSTASTASSTSSTSSTSGSSGATVNGSSTGPGQPLVIHNIGNEVVLGLVHDTVYMGLSDSLLTKARSDMARDQADTGGLGSAFGGFIKKTVGNALGTRVRYPISDIESVRYENGEIKFQYRHRHVMSFESVSATNRKALASFSPADSQRFVAAVNAALRVDENAP